MSAVYSAVSGSYSPSALINWVERLGVRHEGRSQRPLRYPSLSQAVQHDSLPINALHANISAWTHPSMAPLSRVVWLPKPSISELQTGVNLAIISDSPNGSKCRPLPKTGNGNQRHSGSQPYQYCQRVFQSLYRLTPNN